MSRKIFSALAVFCGFALSMVQVYQHGFFESSGKPVPVTVSNIGHRMLGVKEEGYALPFELVSMLLLAALVGCIVIALSNKPVQK